MKKKTALITGITGQDGSYLAELLLDKGYIVHGVRRRSTVENLTNLQNLNYTPHGNYKKLFLHYGDMTDGTNLARLIKEIKPNEVYNLAAQSHVHLSFKIPEYTAEVNALAVLKLMEAIKSNSPHSKFYQASTSEMYGDVKKNIVINEKSIFNPCSPYANSKLYSHYLVKNYRSLGQYAVSGILFNHESPRRGSSFVTMKIIESAIKIKNNELDILYLGNLDAYRDWGYAKEYVNAIWLMMQQKKPSDYLVSTGNSYSVRNFAEITFKKLGYEIIWKGKGVKEIGLDKNTKKILIKIDKFYYRPTEVGYLRGNSKVSQKLLNWKPETNLNQLINLMIESKINKTI